VVLAISIGIWEKRKHKAQLSATKDTSSSILCGNKGKWECQWHGFIMERTNYLQFKKRLNDQSRPYNTHGVRVTPASQFL